ncbi:MAG: tetratricopeptide repeat protein, partial [Pseudanabaena sp. ELA645]
MNDELAAIFDRIANGQFTDADMVALQQLLKLGDREVKAQFAKFNVNIGDGKHIQIGDKIVYQQWDKEAMAALINAVQETNIIHQTTIIKEDISRQIIDLSFQLKQAYTGAIWGKVVELGERILKLNVKHQPTISQTAYAYRSRSIDNFESGLYDLAISDCTRAIELLPKGDYYWQRSRSYHEKSEWDKAIQDCNQALQLEYKAHYYWQRGRAYHNQGNYKQAIADAKLAIQLEPKQGDYYYLCSLSHYALQEFGQALAKLNQAIQYNSNQSQYYFQRGWCNICLHNYGQAINDFSIVSKLDPSKIEECNYWLGISYAGNRNYANAASYFTMAIIMNSKKPYYYFQRGWSYYNQGLYYKAIDDANSAIKLDKTNLDFYKLLSA